MSKWWKKGDKLFSLFKGDIAAGKKMLGDRSIHCKQFYICRYDALLTLTTLPKNHSDNNMMTVVVVVAKNDDGNDEDDGDGKSPEKGYTLM